VRLRLFDILFKQPLTTAALAERLSLWASFNYPQFLLR
jgi:hypothetical protein